MRRFKETEALYKQTAYFAKESRGKNTTLVIQEQDEEMSHFNPLVHHQHWSEDTENKHSSFDNPLLELPLISFFSVLQNHP